MKEKTCVSHVSMVAVKMKTAKRESVVLMAVRMFTIGCFTNSQINGTCCRRRRNKSDDYCETIVPGVLQMVSIRVHGRTGSHEDTMVLCDTGSSQSWVGQELLEKLNLDGEEVTILVAVIHGNSTNQSKEVDVRLGSSDNTAANTCTIMVNSQ